MIPCEPLRSPGSLRFQTRQETKTGAGLCFVIPHDMIPTTKPRRHKAFEMLSRPPESSWLIIRYFRESVGGWPGFGSLLQAQNKPPVATQLREISAIQNLRGITLNRLAFTASWRCFAESRTVIQGIEPKT